MKIQFSLHLRPKPAPRKRTFFYPEDFPILKSLVPVGTSLKKNYKDALEVAFLDPATNPYINEVFEEVVRLAILGSRRGYRHVILGVTSHGFGQNALMALRDFLYDALPVYVDSKNKKGFANSGTYVNELDSSDDIDRLDQNTNKE